MDAGAVSELSAKGNRFRWLPLPGCVATGNAAATDPVCDLSPNRALVDAVLHDINTSSEHTHEWTYRTNPSALSVSV